MRARAVLCRNITMTQELVDREAVHGQECGSQLRAGDLRRFGEVPRLIVIVLSGIGICGALNSDRVVVPGRRVDIYKSA